MLLITGAIIILVYTAVCLIKVFQHKELLINMTGMAIAMALAMISSTAIGLILGILFKGDLTTSTIIAMNFALIVGILVGKPISLLAMGEGVGGGAMGGMMGAMIGDMIPANNYSLMLVYIVIFSIVSFLFIIHLINTKVNEHHKNKTSRTWSTANKAIISVSVLLTLVILGLQLDTTDNKNNQNIDEVHHHH